MRARMKTITLCAVCAVLAACGAAAAGSQLDGVDKRANGKKTYIPRNDVERKNYEAAQRLYDSPTTIIWCTAFPMASTAPLVTVPIAGKLTSSSVSVFATTRTNNYNDREYTPERRSVDGMYHGNPPPYRYGFTPGGEYVDFFNLPTLCTTKPLKFQRQSVRVQVDAGLSGADSRAQAALKRGDKAGAQRILEEAASSE